jgi:hypothetical protein
MSYLAFLLLAAAPAPVHSTPAPLARAQADYDHDMLCYAYNASEAADARKAGDNDKFNTMLPRAMFFRGVTAERFPQGATFVAKRTEAITALSTYVANGGKDLLDAECQARMRVAMNTGG